jgi:hypothetical protein
MRDSDTFMGVIDEGRELEARRLIVLLVEDRFGPPDKPTRDCLQVIDLDRLERIVVRAINTTSWHDLMDTP